MNYFNLARIFLLVPLIAIVVVTPSTLFPFIVGKYVIFRAAVDLAVIFFLLGLLQKNKESKHYETALAKVRADKEREANDGHDGTWVAHPGLVALAREVFDAHMKAPNQINRQRDDVKTSAADLLAFGPETPITEEGLRHNLDVGLQYLGGWLGGLGCVPIHHLMEDAATAEISRAQVWHWVRSPKGVLDHGRKVTLELVRKLIPEELAGIRVRLGEKQYALGKYDLAAKVFDDLTANDNFAEFLTLPCYELLD